jgi:hypothetical protein
MSIVSKFGDFPVPGYQIFSTNKRSTLKSQHQTLVQQYPHADTQLKQLLNLLGDIENLAGQAPATVGESAEWAAIVNAAEGNGVSYCKGLHGKPRFSALYGTYTVTLDELEDLLKASTLAGQHTTQEDGFQEVRRKKRRTTHETAETSKKEAVQTITSIALNVRLKEVVTRNIFAPLRTVDMDTDASGTEATSNEEAVPSTTGRPPPVILTSTANLI